MAKFKEDTKVKGTKAPASQRCNRQHPRSTHQRRLRRQAEALERALHPDLERQEELAMLFPGRHFPKNAFAQEGE